MSNHRGHSPEDLQEWLSELMSTDQDDRDAIIQIPSRERLEEILAMARKTSSPVSAEQAVEFIGPAPQAVCALIEGLRKRGRSVAWIERVVAGWLLALGWPMPEPDMPEPGTDPLYDEAVADVLIWHADRDLNVSLMKVDELANSIAFNRRAVAEGDPVPQADYAFRRTCPTFEVTDDDGYTWRIWSQGVGATCVELKRRREENQ
ncbi:MAG: hypothetical protein ACTH2Q_01540 [Propionibacteriaceae bacterium]